jgi:hypothetical protein
MDDFLVSSCSGCDSEDFFHIANGMWTNRAKGAESSGTANLEPSQVDEPGERQYGEAQMEKRLFVFIYLSNGLVPALSPHLIRARTS